MREGRRGAHILHVNVFNFMAAVACRAEPALAGLSFVLGDPAIARGLVLGISAAAWRQGLRTGLPLSRIRSRRDSRIVNPDFPAYAAAQATLLLLCAGFSPRVENQGGGHLFVDLAGSAWLFGSPLECATRIREAIGSNTGLVATIGLAENKLVAKIASRVAGPGGFIQVPAGGEAEFLARQDIALLGIADRRLNRQLASLGFHEIGDIAGLSDTEVRALFGAEGSMLRDQARGIDHRELDDTPLNQRRIQACHVFPSDTNDPGQITGALLRLGAEAGQRMRGQGWSTRRVSLQIDYGDGYQAEGRQTATRPLRFDGELAELIHQVFDRSQTRRVRIRRITLALELLGHEGSQTDLFPALTDLRHARLQQSLDRSRSRFGQEALLPLSALQLNPKA